jgi:hypothetical protein
VDGPTVTVALHGDPVVPLRGRMIFWVPFSLTPTREVLRAACVNEFTCGLCRQTERIATYRADGKAVTVEDKRNGLATCCGWHWRPGLLTCPDCSEHL